jgi:hypothetical protein
MKGRITSLSVLLKEQISIKPSISKLLQELKNQLNASINDAAGKFEKNKTAFCSPELFDLANPNFESAIIRLSSDKAKLNSWISPNPIKLTLLYRGSRDGFGAIKFHETCDNTQHTVTVIESTLGKIFGGYSDQAWNHNANYKASSKCFLFSISMQEDYKNTNNAYATFAYSDRGPQFGGGADIYIANNCNVGAVSYANWGHSYETKGRPREALAGAYNFTVKEIEVFAVNFA